MGWFYPLAPPPPQLGPVPPGAIAQGNAPPAPLGTPQTQPLWLWPTEQWPAQRAAMIAGLLPNIVPTPGQQPRGSVSAPGQFFGVFLESAEKQFQMFHHMRHVTYDRAASRSNGISLGSLDLTGKLNHDWLLRHSVRHKTYRRIAGGGSSTVDLESLNWKNKRAVRSWMQYHAQLHSELDQFFGLRS